MASTNENESGHALVPVLYHEFLAGRAGSLEVIIEPGQAGMVLAGASSRAATELMERVRSALLNSGFSYPAELSIKVFTRPSKLVSLPAAQLALPVALGVLIASGQLAPSDGDAVYAELALGGSLRPARGLFVRALAANEHSVIKRLLIADDPPAELDRLDRLELRRAGSLRELVALWGQEAKPDPALRSSAATGAGDQLDLADVLGRARPKRALEIAAAGEFGLLFYGPPGSGSALLARRLPGLLPALEPDEQLIASSLHELVGLGLAAGGRPFRAPHHTSSPNGLLGTSPRSGSAHPGELSLAYRGVLLLSELEQFERRTKELLAAALRAGFDWDREQPSFPARTQLLASANPCRCAGECRCTPALISRRLCRASGPLMAELHLCCSLLADDQDEPERDYSSAAVRRRVARARERAAARSDKPESALERIAWTIADLDELREPGPEQLAEARGFLFALSAR